MFLYDEAWLLRVVSDIVVFVRGFVHASSNRTMISYVFVLIIRSTWSNCLKSAVISTVVIKDIIVDQIVYNVVSLKVWYALV